MKAPSPRFFLTPNFNVECTVLTPPVTESTSSRLNDVSCLHTKKNCPPIFQIKDHINLNRCRRKPLKHPQHHTLNKNQQRQPISPLFDLYHHEAARIACLSFVSLGQCPSNMRFCARPTGPSGTLGSRVDNNALFDPILQQCLQGPSPCSLYGMGT